MSNRVRTGLRWAGLILALGCGAFGQRLAEYWIVAPGTSPPVPLELAIVLFATGGAILALIVDHSKM